MKMIKTALVAVFAVFTLSAAAPAAELNTLNKDSVRQLTADTKLPAPGLEEALTRNTALDPVVITVPGLNFGKIGWGPFELSHFLKLYNTLFPKKKMDEADVANAIVSFGRTYFMLDENDHAAEQAEAAPTRAMPDNYLELKLKDIPGYADHDIKIAPFAWSRDPADSDTTIPLLEKHIAQTYDAYKDSGRPIFILAHSWGSVLSHEALHRLEASRPDVKIDRLITAGSPLVPANFVVELFVKTEIEKEHLLKAVTKPVNVLAWHNIWSSRDAYSNSIPAADTNYQTDAQVEDVEPTLIDLILHNKLLTKEARVDLFRIRDIKAWHASYFYDFKAELVSIHKEIYVPIFRPIVAPQVIDCAKAAAACSN